MDFSLSSSILKRKRSFENWSFYRLQIPVVNAPVLLVMRRQSEMSVAYDPSILTGMNIFNVVQCFNLF
jgi:hypothetical protein